MRRRHGSALLAAVCAAASVPVAGAFAVPRSVLPLQLRGGSGGVFSFFGEPRKRTLSASAKMAAVPTPTTESVDIQKCMGNWLSFPRGGAELVRVRARACGPVRAFAHSHAYTAASPSECVTLCRYVQVAIPTPFDRTAHNGLEQYVWNTKKNRVDVTYTFNDGSFTGKQTVVKQKGRANPKCSTGAKWQARVCVPAMLCHVPFLHTACRCVRANLLLVSGGPACSLACKRQGLA